MASYLFTWNPVRWPWPDFQNAISSVNNDEEYEIDWSCGVTKRIGVNDRFFLMRLGKEPKGIVGCGYVVSDMFKGEHWDHKQAAEGKTTLYNRLLFKALSDEPIFSWTDLKRWYPSYEQQWTPNASGVSIPEEIASELWTHLLSNPRFTFKQE